MHLLIVRTSEAYTMGLDVARVMQLLYAQSQDVKGTDFHPFHAQFTGNYKDSHRSHCDCRTTRTTGT
jgi:hypothetical protein